MKEQDLKKMSRTDLIQLVMEQERSMDALQARIITMERQQRERSFRMKKFGSLAEASLQLNGVFEAAQRAANQYLESAAQLSAACKQQKLESDRLLAKTKEECRKMQEQTEAVCRQLRESAELDAKGYWGALEQDLLKRLEDYVPEWHTKESLADLPIPGSDIAEEAPAEEAPVEEAPVEEAPVEEAPVEEAPVEEAPVEEAPVEETSVEETSVEETPVEETPVEEAPAEETPEEEAPAEEDVVLEEPAAVEALEEDAFDLEEIKRLLGDL